eukprot:TRINITY_DN69801_c0_g1_i1.p1 TRINITY_DN69801_c0_g1~~TRINITY_DN69801_c0_g1_i1.p1  ORF type:complete len:272 (-),score=50.28 TRINITY_DN69801_c0_g1_i1:76-891(-)
MGNGSCPCAMRERTGAAALRAGGTSPTTSSRPLATVGGPVGGGSMGNAACSRRGAADEEHGGRSPDVRCPSSGSCALEQLQKQKHQREQGEVLELEQEHERNHGRSFTAGKGGESALTVADSPEPVSGTERPGALTKLRLPLATATREEEGLVSPLVEKTAETSENSHGDNESLTDSEHNEDPEDWQQTPPRPPPTHPEGRPYLSLADITPQALAAATRSPARPLMSPRLVGTPGRQPPPPLAPPAPFPWDVALPPVSAAPSQFHAVLPPQ